MQPGAREGREARQPVASRHGRFFGGRGGARIKPQRFTGLRFFGGEGEGRRGSRTRNTKKHKGRVSGKDRNTKSREARQPASRGGQTLSFAKSREARRPIITQSTQRVALLSGGDSRYMAESGKSLFFLFCPYFQGKLKIWNKDEKG